VLKAMSKEIVHLGPVGSGAKMKLINNFHCGVEIASLADPLPIARSGRRAFLTNAGLAALGLAARRIDARATPADHLAYVGSFTPNGSGISLWRLGASNGSMEQVNVFAADNPSWLTLDVAHRVLYCVHEADPEGRLSAFAIDAASGNLTLINSVGSGGRSQCHLSVHPSGRYVLAANYGSGTVAVASILESGGLGELTDVQGDAGPAGPPHAADSPRGQSALSDHGGPHMHMVQSDPAGQFVIANDAGRDRILRWRLDIARGTLSPAPSPELALEPGSAPRHFAFHPSGRWLYDLQEQDGIVQVYLYDAATAALTAVQSLAVLDPSFAGSFLCSELAVTVDGRFLYAATRLRDTITTFAINAQGRLTRVDEQWTGSDYPRSFAIDPNRRFMYVCNQRGDALTSLRIHPRHGTVYPTGLFAPIGSPACIVFLS
jgi:6-phosphogluconolactonase